jgi:hypothetical protein
MTLMVTIFCGVMFFFLLVQALNVRKIFLIEMTSFRSDLGMNYKLKLQCGEVY